MHGPDKTEQAPALADVPQGWAALLSGRNAIRSLTLAGGVALHAINVFIATTILPSVVRDIGGLPYYAWNTTAFVVMSILGSALSTRLLGIAGPRLAYALAALLFGLGTSVCGAAPAMPVFLVGRALQGMGGGMLLAFAYTMIRLVFPESLWPRAIAIVSGMWGAATLVGPAIGGVFAELGIWRAAFWTLVPLCLLFAALAAVVLPRPTEARSAQPPLPAAQLTVLVLAVVALSAAGIAEERASILTGIATAAAFLAVLVRIERLSLSRLFPAEAFRPAGQLFALYATLSLLEGSVTPCEVFTPLFLQVIHRQPPLLAGYLAALLGVGWTAGSFLTSGASGRTVGRSIAACPILALAGMLGLAMLLPRATDGSWVALAPLIAALTAVGLGIGIAWPHLLSRVLKSVRPGEQDLASASLTTMQLLATAIGAALAGMIANFAGLAHPGGLAGISRAALWLFAIFSLMPALAILTVRRSLAAPVSAGMPAAAATEP